MIADALTGLMLVVGSLLLLLAAVGLVRFPDVFTRLQAAAKGGTLGIGCLMAATTLHFGQLGVSSRALLIVVFFALTAPVAAHMIARAAYFVGVELWKGTIRDELRGQYDKKTHTLS